MALSEASTASLMNQLIGPEFEYYRNKLCQQPGSLLIKLGGAVVEHELEAVGTAVHTLAALDILPVIVHGAGPQIDGRLVAKDIQTEKIAGKRVTTPEVMGVVENTLYEVNHTISSHLAGNEGLPVESVKHGVFVAEPVSDRRLGLVGAVTNVNQIPLQKALREQRIPIISCLGQTGSGEPINVNADGASAALATSLAVSKFVTLSDVPGVLDKNGSLLPVINLSNGTVEELIASGAISGGMIPKVQEIAATVESLPSDASAVITQPSSLIKELFTHQGSGTLIRKGDEVVHYDSIRAVNQQSVRSLIEATFGGHLSQDYFDKLSPNAEVFTTAQAYDGLAIVVPQGEPSQKLPAYMDKLVVRPSHQGYGIGSELINSVTKNFSNGLFWRTRITGAEQIRWYGKIADSETVVGDWMVFTLNVPDKHRAACLQAASQLTPTVIYNA